MTANAIAATYQWLNCDNGNTIITGETNRSYTPINSGNFSVEVSENGCSVTSACFQVNYSGIDEIASTKLILYPNPSVDGYFNIQFEGIITSVELFDISDRIIKIPFNVEKRSLNATSLDAGKYFIRIYSNKGVFIEKLVIVK